MSLFIGIDSGTQSVKVVVIDTDSGEVASETRAPHRMIEGLPPGHMEQDPREWVQAMERALFEVLATVDKSRVRGIGVSGQQHGFVPLDDKGRVIRPAKLWCDTSTGEECAIITRKLGGGKGALRAVGNAILPGYTAPKILWLKRHEPANYRKLRHVLLPHDFLNHHLTGNYFMEPGDASGTALLDVRKRDWSAAAIRAIDPSLADWLPPISSSSASVGPIRPGLAARFGLDPSVVVSAGGGDNMMGAIGTGNVVPGVVSASFGTSGTIYAFSRKPVVDPQGEIAGFCSSTGGWLPLLCTMNVTSVTEPIARMLQLDHAQMDRQVAATPPGADGLVMLPYLSGERTPSIPAGSGVCFGLTARNSTAGHHARAAMEGATLGMNYGLRRLNALGIKPREIRITGGGAHSAAWRQIMADVFGLPVVGLKEEEGAALGAALQAAWCVSRLDGGKWGIEAIAKPFIALDETKRCEPNRPAAALYRDVQAFHDRLSLKLRDEFVAHRKMLDR